MCCHGNFICKGKMIKKALKFLLILPLYVKLPWQDIFKLVLAVIKDMYFTLMMAYGRI